MGKKKWKTVEAGGREALKTCDGGLLVADKATMRVLGFKITSDDLKHLSEALYKRESANFRKAK